MNRMAGILTMAVVLMSWGCAAQALPSASALTAEPDWDERAEADPRVRTFVRPQRILWHDGAVTDPQVLLEDRSGQVTLDASNPCVLNAEPQPGAILLDFGRELHGGVQIMVWHTKDNQPVRLRVRFGESAAEAMSDVGGEKNATNDHAIRDQSVLVPWLGTAEIGNTGFRFVRIDFDQPEGFVQLKAVRAVFLHRDLDWIGTFRCSDERLNEIWRTGAYTVFLNMQDYLWDGIKRDRLVWIGDMHPETMTILAVFGGHDIVPRSLDLIREETPLPKWMNGISSYSMWWVRLQHTWYRYTGDKTYLAEQRAYLLGLLDQLCGCVGPDGAEALTGWRFMDWPTAENKPAIHAGLHALLVTTLEGGAELCDVLKEADAARRCRQAVKKLRTHTPDPVGSKQAAALIALAGLDDAARLNREVLAVGGPRGMSTFYGYYVLQARALAGDHEGAMDVIRRYWGGMLDLGATTFWEDFDLAWTENAGRIDELVPPGKKDIHGDFGNHCYKGFRHSLCHGWASGPTAWLSEHVLGVRIVEPGGVAVRVEPHLAGLDWAEGTVPTARGVVHVRHERGADGRIRTTVKAPPGVRVIRP